MKIIALTVLLTASAFAIGAHYYNIVDYANLYQNKVVPMLKNAEIMAKDPRHIVIGLDITAGREGELTKDREAIANIIGEARLNDRIEVYLIHSRAESEQEALFSVQMPSNAGPAGQTFARAKQKAEQDWQQCWSRVKALDHDGGKKGQTDLVGFLRFCIYQKPEFQESKHPYLILFTDGQQTGDGYNFEKKAPTDLHLMSMANEGFMPDLSGIALWFAGVTPTHGITNSHWRKIQSYWISFARTAGARSVAVSSNRTIRLEDADVANMERSFPARPSPHTLAKLP